MKICIVNSYYYPNILGGAEISTQKLAEQLKELGHDVFVITSGNVDQLEYINGVKVYRIKVNKMNDQRRRELNVVLRKIIAIINKILDIINIFNYKKIKDILNKENVEIIHTNNLYEISFIIWVIAKMKKIKCIHTVRDYNLVCPKNSLINRDGNICNKPKLICKQYRKLNKNLLKYVKCITAPSNFVLNELEKCGVIRKKHNICIYNATNIDKKHLEEIYEKKSNRDIKDINLLYLGTLTETKGLKILLKSFENIKNSNVKLHIAGKGPMEQLVREKCILDSRIKFYGFLEEKEKNKLLEKCDILIAPSIWNEPFGRIVLDAYKYCMPVICFSRGGLSEIVYNNITGIVIDNVSYVELSAAIKYFIMNTNEIIRMGLNCKEKILQFELKKQANDFIALYKSYL